MGSISTSNTPAQPPRAAIYVRVSSIGQEQDGTSLQTQEERCRQYAASRGYDVALFYRETHTGTELWERPKLTALRDAVRHKQVDVVVAYAIDRLSRDPVHLGVVLSEADHHGACIEFVTEPLDESPEGQLIRFVRGYAARIEHEKIRERSIRGRKARAEAGKPIPSARPLYGYRWRDAERSGLDIDPVTGPVVQRIYRRCLEGAPLRAIAAELTADGIPTATGKPAWRRTAVHHILKQEAYTGQATAWRGEFVLPEGVIPPLVSPADWEAVQVRMRRNQERSTRNSHDPESALLRGGFARCGLCGRTLLVATVNKGLSYVCRVSRPDVCRCPSIRVDLLDTAVWEHVAAILTQPEIVAHEIERLRSNDPTTTDIEAVDRNLAKLTRERDNLLQAVALAQHPDAIASLTAHVDQLGGRREQLLNERAALGRRQEAWAAAQTRLDDLMIWCRQIAERLTELTWGQKRLALEALDVAVQLFPHGHEPRYVITAAIPLDTAGHIASSPTGCCDSRSMPGRPIGAFADYPRPAPR